LRFFLQMSERNNQNGSNNEDEIPPHLSSDDETDDETNQSDANQKAYDLKYIRSRTFRNLALNHTYQLIINNHELRQRPILQVLNIYENIFRDTLDRLRAIMSPHSKMRILIHSPLLQTALHVPLDTIDRMTVELIIEKIQSVIQSSKFEGLTGEQLTWIEIGIFTPPSGLGRCGLYNFSGGPEDSRRLKRSIVQIKGDRLCLAKSIYVANCHRLNSNSIRNLVRSTRNFKLELEAVKLHQKLGIPLNEACLIEHVKQFEQCLQVRICVASNTIGNEFIYRGNSEYIDSGTIYLYHTLNRENNIGHFDIITNVKGFLQKKYFCSTCIVAFNKPHAHKCGTYCGSCYRNMCVPTDTLMSCRRCHCLLHSPSCLTEHRKIRPNRLKRQNQRNLSWCDKMWKCIKCKKKMLSKQGSYDAENHICFQKYCNYCHTYCDVTHTCYHRSCTRVKPHTRFLFLDFECDVVNTVQQCTLGYSTQPNPLCETCKNFEDGVMCSTCRICINCKVRSCGETCHIPNFCVIQRTCEHCIQSAIEQGCAHCAVRCRKCSTRKKNGNYAKVPCSRACTQREVVFSGLTWSVKNSFPFFLIKTDGVVTLGNFPL